MLLSLPADCLTEIIKQLNTCDKWLLTLVNKSLLFLVCNKHFLYSDVTATLSICQFLLLGKLVKGEILIEIAANQGQLESLKWLRKVGCSWTEYTCSSAAEGGQLEVLKWLRQEGCSWTESTSTYAALAGHLEVLQWLSQEGCPWDPWDCSIYKQPHIEAWLQTL